MRILKRPLIEFNKKTIYSGFKEDEILTIMKNYELTKSKIDQTIKYCR